MTPKLISKLRLQLLLALALVSTNIVAIAANSAAIVLYGKSVQLLPSTPANVSGYVNVVTYFSTFNGTSGGILVDSTSGGVSGELRPRTGSIGIYEGGYAQANTSLLDYGSYTISIPTTDTNSFGVPDIFQYQRSGNFTASGAGFSALTGQNFTISLSIARSPGTVSGSYTYTTRNSLGQTGTSNGTFNLTNGTGSISYSRGSTNTMTFTEYGVGNSASTTGTTSFTVNNVDSLSYNAFSLTRSTDGKVFSAKAGTLTRSGNTYKGTLSMADGLLETSWIDFTDYAFIVTDNNDTDGNGIPDLTDALSSSPIIITQPLNQTVTIGGSVTLSVVATGNPTPLYQWRFNGSAIIGATSSIYSINNAQTSNAGVYSVAVSNSAGNIASNGATLTVNPVTSAPVFTKQPESSSVTLGSTATISVSVSGFPTPNLQWYYGISGNTSTPITGATSSDLTITALNQTTSYWVKATNSVGSSNSSTSVISVNPINKPAITTDAQIQTSTLGKSAVLSVAASGAGLTYQWYQGTSGNTASPIQGATSSTYTTPFSAQSGSYWVRISNTSGSIDGATVNVLAPSAPAPSAPSNLKGLINLSVRAQVPSDGQIIPGIVLDSPTQVLIRVSGPSLKIFKVDGYLLDPKLTLYDSSGKMVEFNDDWGSRAAEIIAANSIAGAFPFIADSKDAAMVVNLAAGAYTCLVTGEKGTTGEVLLEVYRLP
jgi:Immunoglobulin domain/Ig-like domain CHU_C associated